MLGEKGGKGGAGKGQRVVIERSPLLLICIRELLSGVVGAVCCWSGVLLGWCVVGVVCCWSGVLLEWCVVGVVCCWSGVLGGKIFEHKYRWHHHKCENTTIETAFH